MTQVLQLLTFVGAIAGLVAYGFHRDKKEHEDDRQSHLDFHQQNDDRTHHRGAAMSRTHL